MNIVVWNIKLDMTCVAYINVRVCVCVCVCICHKCINRLVILMYAIIN